MRHISCFQFLTDKKDLYPSLTINYCTCLSGDLSLNEGKRLLYFIYMRDFKNTLEKDISICTAVS
jgi:hypothetical protein